jgi:hypothetical protein
MFGARGIDIGISWPKQAEEEAKAGGNAKGVDQGGVY